ncbi:MAG: glycosyltransferase [Alphaproteobacteria bacterium]
MSPLRTPRPKNSPADVRLGIVCPMANEADNAVAFVRQVLERCDGFRSVVFFCVFDNVCTDGTRDLMRAFAAHEPRVRVVWAPENRSVVDAYVRGYREALAAGCDWILEIDAGFSHLPAEIPLFFEEMESGRDCVFGTRFALGGRMYACSWKRYAVSRLGGLLSRVLLGCRLSDMTSGFQMFRRHALERVLTKGIRSRGPFFQTEIKAYCSGLDVAEVPIHYRSATERVSRGALIDALRSVALMFVFRVTGRLHA